MVASKQLLRWAKRNSCTLRQLLFPTLCTTPRLEHKIEGDADGDMALRQLRRLKKPSADNSDAYADLDAGAGASH